MQNHDTAVMVTARPVEKRAVRARKTTISGAPSIADRLEGAVQFVSRWAGVVVLVAAVAAIGWAIL